MEMEKLDGIYYQNLNDNSEQYEENERVQKAHTVVQCGVDIFDHNSEEWHLRFELIKWFCFERAQENYCSTAHHN